MTATTLTLADFILARVAEDEAVAHYLHNVGVTGPQFGTINQALHDVNARVLADCGAKRAIVEQFRPGRIVVHDSTGVCAQTGEMDDPRGVDVLRALASVYADHPDFDPAWSTAAEFAVGE